MKSDHSTSTAAKLIEGQPTEDAIELAIKGFTGTPEEIERQIPEQEDAVALSYYAPGATQPKRFLLPAATFAKLTSENMAVLLVPSRMAAIVVPGVTTPVRRGPTKIPAAGPDSRRFPVVPMQPW